VKDYSVRTEDAMRMPRPSGNAVSALATHRFCRPPMDLLLWRQEMC